MAKSDQEKIVAEVRKVQDDLDRLTKKAYEQGVRGVGDILRNASRGLHRIGEYDRAEAPLQ